MTHRIRVMKNPWAKSEGCLDDEHRGHFATHDDEVTDGYLFVDGEVDDPLINSLVPSTHKGNRWLVRELLGFALIEARAAWGEKNHPRVGVSLFYRFDRGDERFRKHYHSSAAAVWRVIDLVVRGKGEVSNIRYGGVEETARDSFADEACLKKALKYLGKNSEKVNVPHERAPIPSYDMKNAVVSVKETYRVLRRISDEITSSWT